MFEGNSFNFCLSSSLYAYELLTTVINYDLRKSNLFATFLLTDDQPGLSLLRASRWSARPAHTAGDCRAELC